MNPVERTNSLRTQTIEQGIIKYAAIDGIATLMFGLGLYGKFAVQGDAFHPLLNNSNVVNGLLVAGALIMAWSGFRLLTLMKAKSKQN